MSDDEKPKLDFWAIVEVFGHSKFAGWVTEQAIGGTSFFRVDVPGVAARKSQYGYDVPEQPAFTKLLGAASIFSITPCTQAVALKAAQEFQSSPVTCVDLQPVKAITAVLPSGDDDRDWLKIVR